MPITVIRTNDIFSDSQEGRTRPRWILGDRSEVAAVVASRMMGRRNPHRSRRDVKRPKVHGVSGRPVLSCVSGCVFGIAVR